MEIKIDIIPPKDLIDNICWQCGGTGRIKAMQSMMTYDAGSVRGLQVSYSNRCERSKMMTALTMSVTMERRAAKVTLNEWFEKKYGIAARTHGPTCAKEV